MVKTINLQVHDLGFIPYKKAWNIQKDLHQKRLDGENRDMLLLVEHEPVYTLGKNANREHILPKLPDNVEIFQVERGGDVTFHGPGQVVGYPILDLHNYKLSVSWYMQSLEEVIIKTLGEFNIVTGRKNGLTGVWVKDEKIAALGVRISRWVTMHGFALNVNTDLHYFDVIIPCGISEYNVTSMELILGEKIPISEVKAILIKEFKEQFNLDY